MKTLKDIDLIIKKWYDTSKNDPIEEFYIPCLMNAIKYDRAAGYFSSAVFYHITNGIGSFVNNGGKIRYIISRELSHEDYLIIKQGYDLRDHYNIDSEKMIGEIENWENTIPNNINEIFWRKISNLSFLIQNGNVDIKIAYTPNGIYHEKIGIFYDNNENKISFQGSCNETIHGISKGKNRESFIVFKSWNNDQKEVIEHQEDSFEKLWNNECEDIVVVDFPTIIKNKIQELCKKYNNIDPNDELALWKEILKRSNGLQPNIPELPNEINDFSYRLKNHQIHAIQKWKENNYIGIMELCTGSGKTITAIHSCTRLYQDLSKRKIPLLLVIAVPYINLVDQWCQVLSLYNIYPTKCYGSINEWRISLDRSINGLKDKTSMFAACIVVNKTMRNHEFTERIKRISGVHVFWIGDEVHNHESKTNYSVLPTSKNINYKLGLSATISGCEKIKNYYGPVVHTYSLSEAIEDKILTKYYYYPHIVTLTESEVSEYIKLKSQLAQENEKRKDDNDFDDRLLNSIIGKISNLLGNAENKIYIFEKCIREINRNNSKYLIYCSSTIGLDDDNDDNDISDNEHRQIDKVTKVLFNNGWLAAQYTSRENISIRKRLLEDFKNDKKDALVAIRCLDEGVDIPAVDAAFILSSGKNEKQYIQRSGRVLRKYKGKEFSTIYDLIVLFPDNLISEKRLNATSLCDSELRRVSIFSENAINKEDIDKFIKNVKEKHSNNE